MVRFLILILGLVITFMPKAYAQVEYRFVPYLWTAGIDAEIGTPQRTTSVDASFSDYVDALDAGAAFVFEALGDKWSFTGNFMYVEMSEVFDLPITTVDFENTQAIFELALGYTPDGWTGTRVLGGECATSIWIPRLDFLIRSE